MWRDQRVGVTVDGGTTAGASPDRLGVSAAPESISGARGKPKNRVIYGSTAQSLSPTSEVGIRARRSANVTSGRAEVVP